MSGGTGGKGSRSCSSISSAGDTLEKLKLLLAAAAVTTAAGAELLLPGLQALLPPTRSPRVPACAQTGLCRQCSITC